MKTVIYFGLFLLLLLGRNSLAQNITNEFVLNQQSDTNFNVPYAQPVKIDFHFPIKMKQDYYYNPQRGPDVHQTYTYNGVMEQTLIMTSTDNIVQSYEINNITTLMNYTQNGNGNPMRLVKFTIDTVEQILKNIYVYYNWAPLQYVYEIDSFKIASLPYSITWNHHLFASSQGAELFSKLSEVFHFSSTLQGDGMGGGTQNIYLSVGLSTDTQSYKFSIDISSTDPAFVGVSVPKSLNNDFFKTRVDDHSELITFGFSSANQPRELKIYDLMGREVYHSSVTPGVTSLFMSKNILASGCYIAMLGNSRTKFILSK